MKKFIIMLVCSVCFYSATVAQNSPELPLDTSMAYRNKLFSKGRIRLTLKGGFTVSDFYGKDLALLSNNAHTSVLQGFVIGIAADDKLGEYIGLKHELTFQQVGSGIALQDSSHGHYNSTLKMYVLQVLPIAPTFYYHNFQFYTGPYISALLSGAIQKKDTAGNYFWDSSIYGTPTENMQQNKYLQKFDFGIVLGTEYQLNTALSLGIRYSRGFTPILDNANVNTFGQAHSTINIYNQTWCFALNYHFSK
ncbi:outer membrane beta-barrel protein [Flectobacillus major]|uniref:outer membrane beta-barrel protein n=1 Tax=Flectobacillus major TaxID=103 RepID=UPI0004789561|nr:outer membrane beta-barrel protein [Flectobacillus major]